MENLLLKQDTSDSFSKPVIFNPHNAILEMRNLKAQRLNSSFNINLAVNNRAEIWIQACLMQKQTNKKKTGQNLCCFHCLPWYLRKTYKSEKGNWHLVNVPGASLILLHVHNQYTKKLALVILNRWKKKSRLHKLTVSVYVGVTVSIILCLAWNPVNMFPLCLQNNLVW